MSAILGTDLLSKLSQNDPNERVTVLVALHTPEMIPVKMQEGDASFSDARIRAINQRKADMEGVLHSFKKCLESIPDATLNPALEGSLFGIQAVTLPLSSLPALRDIAIVKDVMLDKAIRSDFN